MTIATLDPKARELDDAFAAAMTGPAKPRTEPKTPDEIDPEAPFGREDDGSPKAPHGYRNDGSIRRTGAGRKSKDGDTARVAKPGQQAAEGKPGKDKVAEELAEPGQYAKELSDTADGIWFAMSALGKAAPGIPLIGSKIPAQRIQAQAAVWFATKDRAVAAVSLAAEHNASAARFARKLQGGDITWMITCVSLVAPILSLSGMVWSKDADAQLAGAEQPSVAELAKRNEAAMDEAVSQMITQAAVQAAAQEASVNGQAAAS